ncbi:hypothetical protein HII31_08238 [Pseudocercospora fuligena]|uniref:Uncharacterized protein n=1 Tax=Pseudocercospora fuligena TaxID=685502 RepID=A0A8H6RFD4_9PEZI|nr:hypothetical protein HII31_08238 [Pseudocercospora fuligena]
MSATNTNKHHMLMTATAKPHTQPADFASSVSGESQTTTSSQVAVPSGAIFSKIISGHWLVNTNSGACYCQRTTVKPPNGKACICKRILQERRMSSGPVETISKTADHHLDRVPPRRRYMSAPATTEPSTPHFAFRRTTTSSSQERAVH